MAILEGKGKTLESTFIEKERLLPGGDMSVTADGLLFQSIKLHVLNRIAS